MKLSTAHPRPRDKRRSVVNRVRDRETGGRGCFFFVILALYCFINHLSSVAAETFVVRVARFLDEEALTTCNESILMADEDGNGELDSSDFTTLIEILTLGAISVDEIADLPLRLRTVYHMTACLCVFEPGASSDCCVGDASSIPIEEIDSESPSTANRVFCSEVARGIEDVKEDVTSPTSTPVSPSSAPTEQSVSPSTVLPQQVPTVSPSQTATEPVETLCINFQYEVMNNQSLSADDIMNEVDNSLKDGLIEATRTTVINILNETYPRTNGARAQSNELPGETDNDLLTFRTEDTSYLGQVMFPDGHYRKLLQAAEQADAAVLEMELPTYYAEIHDGMLTVFNATKRNRRLYGDNNNLRRSRRLVYYSDEFPVVITQIADSTTCPGRIVNESIRCAVVSSTVCVVLEPGDNPVEIRKAIVDGLTESFMNGDFVDNIPPGSLGS